MIRKLTIRRKLLISVVIACLIPFITGIFYIKTRTESWLFNNNLKESKLLVEQTAQYVDGSVLIAMQNMVKMIAEDERLIYVDPKINNYLDYDKESSVPAETESERQITGLFRSAVETNDIVTFISYGTGFGGYIEYPQFRPSGPYDPRERSWYTETLKKGGSLLSEPYQTKMTKELVVSINDIVHNGQATVGVVCLTISLDNLMKKLGSITYGESGYVLIVSPQGKIINSPKNTDWLLKPYEETGIGSLDDLKQKSGGSFEGMVDGVDSILTVYTSSESSWTYVVVNDKSEVLGYSKSLSGLLVAILALSSGIMIILVTLIADYITRPVAALTVAIKKMSNFDFDSYEHSDIIKFTDSQDEIGEISRVLVSMQDNFLELQSSLKSMDEEIRSIKVEETQIRRVTLSKNNPLGGIAASVNALLDKVAGYITCIREINQEISDKNGLLTASEEELITQLDEINEQKEKIYFLAEHDSLTDLPNRRNFIRQVEVRMQNDSHGAIILINIDNFKNINDTWGHIIGDKVLIAIAEQLKKFVQKNVFVSRFGGDEFLILFECQENTGELPLFVDLVFRTFNDPIDIDGIIFNIEFSMGISRFPEDSMNFDQIMMNADLALHTVKRSGKHHYAFFNLGMENHLRQKNEVKTILQHALNNDGFKMVYQPKVSLDSGTIVGYEALVRLKDYNLSPGTFIQTAEEYGMIIPLGRVVTQKVIEQMARWREQGMKAQEVSINFCALQLYDADYIDFLFSCLRQNDISPELIQIEITEHIFIDNKALAISFMDQLRKAGVKIALDDFGAEYSSLNFLSTLPVDTLKFDQEMNLRLLSLKEPSVMEKLVAFVHSLKLPIVAEGIETLEQVLCMKGSGCDVIQGYYFSRPVEADEVPELDTMVYVLEEKQKLQK